MHRTGDSQEDYIVITNRLPSLHLLQYEDVLRRALAEDLGRGGDLTTDAVMAPKQSVSCRVISRGAGVVAGLEPAVSTLTSSQAT